MGRSLGPRPIQIARTECSQRARGDNGAQSRAPRVFRSEPGAQIHAKSSALIPPNPVFIDPILPGFGQAPERLEGEAGLGRLPDGPSPPTVHQRDHKTPTERPVELAGVAALPNVARDPREGGA